MVMHWTTDQRAEFDPPQTVLSSFLLYLFLSFPHFPYITPVSLKRPLKEVHKFSYNSKAKIIWLTKMPRAWIINVPYSSEQTKLSLSKREHVITLKLSL